MTRYAAILLEPQATEGTMASWQMGTLETPPELVVERMSSLAHALARLAAPDLDLALVGLSSHPTIARAVLAAVKGSAAHLPIVAILGPDAGDLVPLVLELGAADYLDWASCSVEALSRTVRHVCERYQVEAAIERQRAVEWAAQAEFVAAQRTNEVLAGMSEGFLSLDRQWRFTYINPVAEKMLGRSRAELLNRTLWDVYPRLSASTIGQVTRQIASGGEAAEFEAQLSQSGIWLRVRAYPSTDGIAVYAQDITEQKQHESAVRLRTALLDTVAQAVMLLDAQGRLLFANRFAAQLFGSNSTSMHGRSAFEFLQTELSREQQELIFRRLQAGEHLVDEFRIRPSNGQPFWALASLTPQFSTDDALDSIIIVLTDVTVHKRLEETLQRQNGFFAALHQTTLSLLTRLDLTELLDAIVTRAAELLDAADGFVLLSAGDDAVPALAAGAGRFGGRAVQPLPLGAGPLRRAWRQNATATERGQRGFWRALAGDGDDSAGHVIAVRLRLRGQTGGLLGLARAGAVPFSDDEQALLADFAQLASLALDNARLYGEAHAELRQREQAVAALDGALHRNEAQTAELEAILRHLGDGLMLADALGSVTRVNPAAYRILGVSPSTAPQPDEIDYWRAATIEGEPLVPSRLPLARALRGERLGGVDVVVPVGAGGEQRVISTSAAPLFGPSGELSGAVAALRDVTDERAAQQQLLRNERLRALGELASGVAHDFNNLLAVILGRCELLQSAVDQAEQQAQIEPHREVIRRAALDGVATVRRLQLFTPASHDGTEEAIDLTSLMRDVVEYARPRWQTEAQRAGIEIEMRLAAEPLPSMLGSAAALREVLVNLVFNALDALPRGGTLTLSSHRRGDKVRIILADTGSGMSEFVRQRVFDRFFSTKGAKGAGLGLSMAKGIIEGMNGSIAVDSVPGSGSTFTIELPFRPAERADVAPPAAPDERLRLLLVDDDEEVLQTMAELLTSADYDVTAASDADAALALARKQQRAGSSPFDVVLSDLSMPGRNGFQLISALRESGVRAPCILITGWPTELDEAKAKAAGVDALLAKPVLLTELRSVLEHAASPAARHQIS